METTSVSEHLLDAQGARAVQILETPRRSKKAKAASACAVLCGLLLLLLAVAIVISLCRRRDRARMLNPLLDTLNSSDACFQGGTDSCAVEFAPAPAHRFHLHPAENPLLGFLFHELLARDLGKMREILSGANFISQDANRTFYRFFKNLPGAYSRISSHRSTLAQYGVPEGAVLVTLLIGYVPCPHQPEQNCTWAQFEGSGWDPLHRPIEAVGHVLDYFHYRLCHCNVGPLGTSRHTDANPLIIDEDVMPPAEEACPLECPSSDGKRKLDMLHV